MGIKKLFATDESRTTIMLIGGVVSLLAALAMAVAIWQRWNDTGILLGPKSLIGVIVCSVVGVLLAVSTGIWALTAVNQLTGRNAMKCILGYLMDASALAIIGAFGFIAHFLRAVAVS